MCLLAWQLTLKTFLIMALTKLTFNIQIAASPQRVWDVLWGNTTYGQWTAPFDPRPEAGPGRMETDLQQGSKVRFLSGGSDAGMVALIERKDEPTYIAFRHLGMVREDGTEDLDSDEVKQWAGAQEDYRLEARDGGTHLTASLEATDAFKDYFSGTFPAALQEVKRLAEAA